MGESKQHDEMVRSLDRQIKALDNEVEALDKALAELTEYSVNLKKAARQVLNLAGPVFMGEHDETWDALIAAIGD